jgi:enoyl-CoA hydratase/carnithine racemase
MDQSYETLLIERLDPVVRITLNRPEKRNAISHQLQQELVDAVERCAADPEVHVVVVRGAGPSFCSGYDIAPPSGQAGEPPSLPRHALGALAMGRMWSRIWYSPVPVIAQVHGHCLAGGTDLAQHCDLIVVAENATIGFPALRMGGTPPANMWLYNVGPQWAKRLLLTGDTFTGRLAARIGFALEAVAEEDLDAHVLELARRIAATGRDIVAINKHVLNQAIDLMGRHSLQEISGPMDAIANQAAEMQTFRERAAQIGLAAAFKERDEPFRQGGPLDI